MDGNDEVYSSLYGGLFPEPAAYRAPQDSDYAVDHSAGDAVWTGRGFIPGQDNGDWKWNAGAGAPLMNLEIGLPLTDRARLKQEWEDQRALEPWNTDYAGKTYDDTHPLSEDERWAQGYKDAVSPEGSGTWFNEKDPYNGLDYRPTTGYNMTAYDSAPTGMRKYMPALTMAVMAAMSGGAALSAMPAGAGALGAAAGGAASAVPSAMYTGLNTGDWGKSLTNIGMGAVGGGLSSYGSTPLMKGLIGAGVNTAGKAATGQDIDAASVLGNLVSGIGSNYLGNYVGDSVGTDSFLGDFAKGATTGLSKSAIQSLMQGKTPQEQQMIMTLLSAAGKSAMDNV